MAQVTVYGESDDLIEVDGAIYEEFVPPYDGDSPAFLAFSDGTVLAIEFTGDGFWRIHPRVAGTATLTKHEGTDEDTDYSDRVTLDGDLAWVVFGSEFAKAKP